MRKLIAFILLSSSVVSAQSFEPPIEYPSGICLPGFPLVNPPTHPEHCSRFTTHEEAERNWYHCAEGVAIMGAAIYQLNNKFVPVLSTEDFARLSGNECEQEIYPDSGICYSFSSHLEAEQNYASCRTTNFQYWDYLQKLQLEAKGACANPKPLKDGANKGNLSKPNADPVAKCKNGWTVLLDSQYQDVTKLTLLDKDKKDRGVAEYFGFYQGNRPRFCFRFPGSKFGNDPVYFSFTSSAQGQCLKVTNASQRED